MDRFDTLEKIGRLLERDQESWVAPHKEAMEFFDQRDTFQEHVAWLNGFHAFISSFVHSWEVGLGERTHKFDESKESRLVEMHRWWLARCEPAMGVLAAMEAHAVVSGAGDLRSNMEASRDYVERTEKNAARQRRRGLRGIKLDPSLKPLFDDIASKPR